MTIWKYKLSTEEVQYILMPYKAEIISVQMQDGEPHVWALVDSENIHMNICFETFVTGQHIPNKGRRRYLNTYQKNGLVFHVFERND